ncbi:uncharacterized protein LACBIDRAFT_321007 [Laccaria bicolor S238N-H82]|uniref:Predicted protein n=1 Tax=Laccaria bicolor (strain S238N-H82 / ATCC MYA-4686) TaxID=486041 RepID=B0CNH0_LACBS|nr:uncharacterized protein LACBIDRAFT_321007 [Laccaria bicolor S238N-H82]EDR15926.1 predicted protein [Laccaria bicolor S238N-H82]|eukprot:XP_001874134.1 predicted protein [Laccaria bicolor S238N-H82]
MFFPLEQHLSWRFPFVLGKVSRYWRQVAYGAPTLWSHVDVSPRRHLDGLQVYLGRSKGSPINLDITFIRQSAVSKLIGILRPHYRHCRSIRVKAENSYELTTEISSILDSGHYPMLRHICVEGFDTSLLQPFAIVADAVNLTNVRLRELTIALIVNDDLIKLRRETANVPRFTALKSLTLAPRHNIGAVLTTVADADACFPGIKLLILPNFNKLSSFVRSTKTMDSRPFWPELDGLAVRDIDDQGVLYEFVQDRQRSEMKKPVFSERRDGQRYFLVPVSSFDPKSTFDDLSDDVARDELEVN